MEAAVFQRYISATRHHISHDSVIIAAGNLQLWTFNFH